MINKNIYYRIKTTIRNLRLSKDKFSRIEMNMLNGQRHRNGSTFVDIRREIAKHENHLCYLLKNRHYI